ncbi:arylesterase [Sphingomonas antarctica]|uniref:arylesterase n=1 Tax=Sphingomonas antarctica TaxID=2040274 RepID=UPI0039E99EC8
MALHSSGPTILALGDSLTAGYGLQPGDAFPAQLERLLRATTPDARVINGGVSGDTTMQGLARLPRLLSSQSRKPDLAIVALGANDMIRGVPAATMRSNLDAILSSFDDCGIPALLAGMVMPSFLGADFARRYNAVFADLAAKHGILLYPFFLQGVVGDPTLLLADRVHPNARAIGIVARNILPMVNRALLEGFKQSARSAA